MVVLYSFEGDRVRDGGGAGRVWVTVTIEKSR